MLPDHWEIKRLSEVVEINKRSQNLSNLSDEMSVTFVPMAAVDAEIGAITKPEIRPLAEVRKGFTQFSEGDVIFAKITPSMENGKAAIATNLENGLGFGSTEFHVIRPNANVIAKFIFYFVRQESFRNDAKAHFAGTAGQLRVPKSFIENYQIPIPPIYEQERIVERIESLFTQLEAGVAGLKRAQAALKRYRASVLKAAVEGRLVPQDPNDEPAEELLKRIREEKGEKADSISGQDNNLPKLPQGWVWTTWKQLVSLSQNGFGKRKSATGMPTIVLRLADVVGNKISLDGVRRIGATKEEIEKYQLLYRDLICIRVNGSLDNVGRMVLHESSPEPLLFCDHFIRFRLVEPEMATFYSKYFDTDRARKFIELNRVSSAGQNTISQSTLFTFMVPLPPVFEQQRIIKEIDRRFSVIDQMELSVIDSFKRAERMRQAILKQAFMGKL